MQGKPSVGYLLQQGWQFHRVYADRISGSEERRNSLDDLIADARRGISDIVVVWRFDRFARSAM